jgi:hypothetical protein
MSEIDRWARFLEHERLDAGGLEPDDAMRLVALCERLAASGPPAFRPYPARLESRRLLVATAMAMGLDLTALRGRRGRVAMGRGLLDAWNAEYVRRYGSAFGTAGVREASRRDVKTRLAELPR